MYKPIISIDIAKSKSCAAAFLDYDVPYLKPFSFNHSLDGIHVVLQVLHDLHLNTGIKPDIVLEATGNYSKPISSFFFHAGFNVIILNPLLTHQQKNKSIRKIKTDPVDAYRYHEPRQKAPDENRQRRSNRRNRQRYRDLDPRRLSGRVLIGWCTDFSR